MDIQTFLYPTPHVVIERFVAAQPLALLERVWPARPSGSGPSRVDRRVPEEAASLLLQVGLESQRRGLLADLGEAASLFDLGSAPEAFLEYGPGEGTGLARPLAPRGRPGLRPAATAILFVHTQWEGDWGGRLELWPGPHPDASPVSLTPTPGRLVLLGQALDSWISVEPPRCPAGLSWRALRLVAYSLPRPTKGRATPVRLALTA